ncbi:hypothetical protein B9Z55_027858 [Caenorhabditis nigoni]|uniref:Small ubiquitin-related modifier n=1 Tax=Caenorhabditis nigoni TaxID=1611254 RepID=A0A2G5SE41_9PELO|nr:hypothetical protein B9Z55_027858 [Caenorhabditis nigoni]
MADKAFAEATPGGDNAEYMNITVVGQDGSRVYFRVKSGTLMAKMKKRFAERVGVSVNSLRFVLGDRRINDEDTPMTLEMEDDDIVEAYQEHLGG